jgi:uncharacterized protein YcbK (DUF882 family)
MGDISKNFSYYEFLVSDSYPELASQMTLSDYEKKVLKLLVDSILQFTADTFGIIDISSGKRSQELNIKLGGADDSDHLYCCAADFTLRVGNTKHAFNYIKQAGLIYRELIYYPERGHCHVSINIPGRKYKHISFLQYNDHHNEYV